MMALASCGENPKNILCSDKSCIVCAVLKKVKVIEGHRHLKLCRGNIAILQTEIAADLEFLKSL